MKRRIVTVLVMAVVVTASALLLGACSKFGAEPWERDLLARPEMGPHANSLDNAIDDHIYFSREASSGGRGFGGGGCGCN